MSKETVQQEVMPVRGAKSRVRRFLLRHVPLAVGGGAVLLVLLLVGLYFYASSDSFQNVVRERLAREFSNATGGRVEIAAFRWRLLKLEAEADGVVIHGREAANEAPYARIEHLQAQISILGILSPSVRLANLEVQRPTLHVIVYSDGTTNQPEPRRKSTTSKPAIESLFDLKVGHLAVEDGFIDYDNHASTFDFQSRRVPLDFAADNVAVQLRYVDATGTAPAKYEIELGATDMTLARGAGRKREPEVHGRLQGMLELTRSAANLRQFTLSETHGKTAHVLTVSGILEDFTRPRWHGTIQGDLDMRLLEPALGYPFAPEGIARLSLTAKGTQIDFAIDGRLHVDDGAYVGPGVNAHGITLDARVHADFDRLLIDQTVVKFREGGQMEGTVDLHSWRPPREQARLVASPTQERRGGAPSKPAKSGPVVMQATADQTIPVDGKVTAELKNLSLDTILSVVGAAPFQRLGIGALLNGPADATWSRGDNDTVIVSTKLALDPQAEAGEAPTSGLIDARYTNKDGAVDVRKLELVMPNSAIEATGHLGAYPMTSPTSLSVSLHSQNLEEFDTVLRELRLQNAGRVGADALPAKLRGQMDFIGTWTGTLLLPRISGALKATQLALEVPGSGASTRFVNFDTVDAAGSYNEERISIDHAVLAYGAARLAVNGTLEASQVAVPSAKNPRIELKYNDDSMLHAKVEASNITADDLQMFVSAKIPATGTIDASFEAHGPLSKADGSGWGELESGTLWGHPVTRARVQGALEGTTLKLTQLNARVAGGSITGSGNYDFSARLFDIKAHGSGIEIAQIDFVQRRGWNIEGKTEIDVTGSGTLDDPRLDGRAKVRGLMIEGDAQGDLDATAQTADHAVHYDVKTTLTGAELNLRGQTDLQGEQNTDNHLEFTHLDIGALLRLAHVNGISGESALAGTVTLAGPLQRPEALHGDVRLQQVAVILSGVRLTSEGDAHATLADGRLHLDPVHVTGENTDVHVMGTMAVIGERRMDLTANGSVNMKLAETLEPDLTASGTTTFEVEAHGTVQNPGLRGTIDVQNGALALEDLPNGLSQIKGTLEFNQNRLEVRNLTAFTGGGQLSVGGFLAYQHGLYTDLSVTGKGLRIRYPQGVSSLTDATLRLQGAPQNLLLSGNVLITRFATSPDLDLAALAAQANSKTQQTVVLPNSPSNHVRLNVHLVSSPQLNFQNAIAKLAGDVDLRISGTLATPSVLGRVSITEGSAMIAGTRYELQRGDITLTNPVRIEPVIDMTAMAHVEDYDITLGLHGTLQKMSVSYRSDPPLPEVDVLSLLALGHTQDQRRLYTQQQEQEFSSPSTDALLGGALNATVSNRMQKLFGAGSVKVDPNYLGAFGNSTSRVTVQEQVGRNLTLTYATNVNTTGQQLLQAEVAINRHFSLVVARDESGVFSMVLKNTRRYK